MEMKVINIVIAMKVKAFFIVRTMMTFGGYC